MRSVFDATEDLAKQLFALIDLPLFDNSTKLAVSDTACSLSLEYWLATCSVLRAGLLPSGAIIHRAQFEALVRSIWILYVASETQVRRLDAVLTTETEQGAKNSPQVSEMMADLSKMAPQPAYDALHQFKDNSWKALSSYAHAGIHPIRRHVEGYPIPLIEAVVKNSNGLAVLGAMQAAVLTGVQSLQRDILELAAQYPECMPPQK
jgi:hypothetical protein